MNSILLILVVLVVLLAGCFILAIAIASKYGDYSACYKLYEVRDKLIHAVVFDGVSRDNSCFDELYRKVNNILRHSHSMAGPVYWPLAIMAGKDSVGEEMEPDSQDDSDSHEVPEALSPIMIEVKDALDYLLSHHMVLVLFLSSRAKEERRLQKIEARELRDVVLKRCHQHCTESFT